MGGEAWDTTTAPRGVGAGQGVSAASTCAALAKPSRGAPCCGPLLFPSHRLRWPCRWLLCVQAPPPSPRRCPQDPRRHGCTRKRDALPRQPLIAPLRRQLTIGLDLSGAAGPPQRARLIARMAWSALISSACLRVRRSLSARQRASSWAILRRSAAVIWGAASATSGAALLALRLLVLVLLRVIMGATGRYVLLPGKALRAATSRPVVVIVGRYRIG